MDSGSFNMIEAIFLGAAVLVSLPLLFFIKWILKELKNEQSKQE